MSTHPDAYTLILEAIDAGIFKPGERLVEVDLAERFGVSRTPVREALQRLETQSLLARDGRSLIVASLDHNQLAELYAVRAELEGLAARLAARHAIVKEQKCLRKWCTHMITWRPLQKFLCVQTGGFIVKFILRLTTVILCSSLILFTGLWP